MKKLFIIRHAKSDQSFFGNDFERPLNERGKTDAPLMARRLKEKQPLIDAFISSPAKRAKKTAQLFAQVFDKTEDDVILITALYHAPAEVFYEEIGKLPDTCHTVAIFSHNPGITYFANDLISNTKVDNMPTCAVFAVQADILSWSTFAKAKKEFLFFDHPKLIK